MTDRKDDPYMDDEEFAMRFYLPPHKGGFSNEQARERPSIAKG